MKLYDLAEKYADEVIQSNEFQRLLFLQEEIKKNLKNKIVGFKTAEAKYLEVKQYGKYHPDLEKYQRIFMEKKKSLYEEPLIQEYKELERAIQSKLDCDLDELKMAISNKFHLSQKIF